MFKNYNAKVVPPLSQFPVSIFALAVHRIPTMMKIKNHVRDVLVIKLFVKLMEKLSVFVHQQNHFSMEKNAIHAICPHFGTQPHYYARNAQKDISIVFKLIDA